MKVLKIENIRLHIIVWLIYIVYERATAVFNQGSSGGIWNGIAIYTVNIAFFYFNAHVVLPSAVDRGNIQYLKLAGLIVCETLMYVACKLSAAKLLMALHVPITPPLIHLKSFIIGFFVKAFVLLGQSTAYWFALATYYNGLEVDELKTTQLNDEIATQQLEKNLLLTENAFLKSQINPHFLLNTLNFLYNSVSKYSEQVADSFMTLADIMRYALTDAGEDDKVCLEAELEHIANFIKLNRVRFNQRLCVEYVINGETGDLRIIPLVLVTLVENLFKYGDLLNQGHPARIIADISGNNLTFTTHNLKRKNVANLSHGIGLTNVRGRLTMYHQFELDVEDNETVYESTLKIQL